MDNLIKCQCKSQQAINTESVHRNPVAVRITEQLPQQCQQGGQAQDEPGSGLSLWSLRMVFMESHTQGLRRGGDSGGSSGAEQHL